LYTAGSSQVWFVFKLAQPALQSVAGEGIVRVEEFQGASSVLRSFRAQKLITISTWSLWADFLVCR
jgi:hypothetical protein